MVTQVRTTRIRRLAAHLPGTHRRRRPAFGGRTRLGTFRGRRSVMRRMHGLLGGSRRRTRRRTGWRRAVRRHR